MTVRADLVSDALEGALFPHALQGHFSGHHFFLDSLLQTTTKM